MLAIRRSVVVSAIVALPVVALPVVAFAQENLPMPPADYDRRQNGVPEGMVSSISYPTTSYGMKPARVYTPPGYSTDTMYPVLYLHHGIGGDETSWTDGASAHIILDNLIAEGLAVPMIVVMPMNSMTSSNDFGGYGQYESVIIPDLIPYIEDNYSAATDRTSRAIAGLSMGGGITFNVGFANIDLFAYIGPFSAAPNTASASQTIRDPEAVARDVKLIMITCGSADGLLNISEGYHDYLDQQSISHEYLLDPGQGHTTTVWKRSLYNFAQGIFTDANTGTGGMGGQAGMGGGGETGTGGASAGGADSGSGGNGGAVGTAGNGPRGDGGADARGGTTGTSGSGVMGGSPTTGGMAGAAPTAGGQPTTTGSTDAGTGENPADDDGGCACSLPGSESRTPPLALFAAAAAVVLLRGRTGRRTRSGGD